MTRTLVLLFLFLVEGAIATAQNQEPEDLQFLVLEALNNNRAIAAELDRMDAGAARIPQAGSLDDPVLTFRWMEFPSTSIGKSKFQNIELMQMVRFPTKLSTQSSIAEIRADHAHHQHLETVLNVVSTLKSSVAMLWYARTAFLINKENQQLLGQIVSAAERNYTVGRVQQSDVLRARIELARAKAEESSILQEITTAESMVRSLLNRSPASTIGPLMIDSTLVELPKPESLIRFALRNKPMLVHDSLSVTESELMVSLAKQEYIPDLRFSLEYVRMPMVPQQLWTVSAGLSLPFAPWTLAKADSRVEEARAESSMRTNVFQNAKNMVDASIRSAYARVEASETMVITYERDILPQTLQSLQSLLTEYQTGQSSYLVLIDSYRMYEMTRMDAAKSRMEYIKNLAMLERETGVVELSVVPQEESRP